MKNIKSYKQYLNEELNILKGPSDKDTDDAFNEMEPNEALNWSIDHDLPQYIKKAAEKGANLDELDFYGDTYILRYLFDDDITKALIEAGADLNIKDRKGDTVLIIATTIEKIELIKLLINSGANINIRNKYGDTALIIACQKGNLEIVKLLIESDADLNFQNKHTYTALMEASMKGNLEIVKLLVEAGANINIKSDVGDTAIIYAARFKRWKIVDFLHSENPSEYIPSESLLDYLQSSSS